MSDNGSQSTSDTSALSYEQARDELVQVVNRLEQGGATLEESLQLWERGEALAARCEEWLLGARKRLEAARAGDPASENDTADAGSETNGPIGGDR
ncbi:exodeoxyribonuclease VII small subunit [Leucobacter sp. UT-8R-CII-1-4]|uniref:exodeoxyribonuclease VII small subunit n=1 Tax=Leucobacter sp. UT-8R-CII-1-4 TaxID=3040075 RepID=UPI0024A9263E|nr:exodeoxyribonuclease VII small subunit [Leucobacter sp. UT-8R-CII-1-4]MDI6022331.1 exodeoxyribonuclease VII small subunit [Leucobacter sp. UT-8R-CII-1-4]